MSEGVPSLPSVTLTPVQQRTLDELLAAGDPPAADPGLEARFRARIDAVARSVSLPADLWLGKSRLTDLDRCEGFFLEGISGRGEPFEHSVETAAGALAHKAIEVETGARDDLSPHDLADAALGRLDDDAGFQQWWREQDRRGQEAALSETVRRIEQFRASFPPLRPMRGELRPVAEYSLRAEFAGGAVNVSGRIDLMLGALEAGRPTRVLLDLKTRGARPEHPEDMRLYALLHLLRFGVAPRRVATFFLDSGGWQPEEVTEETLSRAADRVERAIVRAARLLADDAPVLTPGAWCAWCGARETCPSGPAGLAQDAVSTQT